MCQTTCFVKSWFWFLPNVKQSILLSCAQPCSECKGRGSENFPSHYLVLPLDGPEGCERKWQCKTAGVKNRLFS